MNVKNGSGRASSLEEIFSEMGTPYSYRDGFRFFLSKKLSNYLAKTLRRKANRLRTLNFFAT